MYVPEEYRTQRTGSFFLILDFWAAPGFCRYPASVLSFEHITRGTIKCNILPTGPAPPAAYLRDSIENCGFRRRDKDVDGPGRDRLEIKDMLG